MKIWIGVCCLIILSACADYEQEANIDSDEIYSGGKAFTTFNLSQNAFGAQASGLAFDQEKDFVVGNSLFQTNWVSAPASVSSLDGLGVLMNATSCGGCHFKDGRAKPTLSGNIVNGLLFRISKSGTQEPHDVYGGQFQNLSILNVLPEGKVSVTYRDSLVKFLDGQSIILKVPDYTFDEFNYGALDDFDFSPRIAPQLCGGGLLEAISEQTILAFADETDQDLNGISGKPNYVWDEKSKKLVLGRFGWKSNQPNLLQQTAGAFNGDMGITSSIFTEENVTEVQHQRIGDIISGGSPELSEEQLAQITFYLQALAVPARRNLESAEVISGKQIFSDIGCETCHISKMTTGNSHEWSMLHNVTIRPFSDLLLHDMGKALADNKSDGEASGTEWRTPPLWGIGMIPTVNGHSNLLHDGRAFSIEEAIIWHGGEASLSKEKFMALSEKDRKDLIQFLQSL